MNHINRTIKNNQNSQKKNQKMAKKYKKESFWWKCKMGVNRYKKKFHT